MSTSVAAPPSTDQHALRRLAVRRGALVLVAVLLAQAAWILALPPFRGADEVDHVFRAAGVAQGQWHLSQGAPQGRGLLVWVPGDLVTAAQPQCRSLPYNTFDNCHALRTRGDLAQVATSAGNYDPTFYFVVGSIAKPFHGATADYVMRIATAVMMALLLAVGVAVFTYAGTGLWSNLGVLAAFTAEVMYSGAVPSPNGIEMALGFVLWASLLAVVRRQDTPRGQGRLLVLAFVAAFPLAFLRMLGPLWILLIVGSVVAYAGTATVRDIGTRHRRVVIAVTGLVALGLVWWATWHVIASHVTGDISDRDNVDWILAFNLPAFTMQMVGAFPFRDQPAPLGVYPLAFFVIGLLVIAAWRRGAPPRARRVVFWVVVTSLAVPVILSLMFMPSLGAVWQGRYELPFVIGILPLCGLVLDDAGFAPREGRRLVALSLVFLGITQVACVMHVEQGELGRHVSAGDPAWVHPQPWLVGAMMVVAWLLACGLYRLGSSTKVTTHEVSSSPTA